MAEKSGVRLRLHLDQLPYLAGAVQYAEEWLFPGGSHNNQRFYEPQTQWANGISDEMRLLLYTPETSGGLLVAVPPQRLETLTALFAKEGHPCWVIGEVTEGQGIEVTV
jgi:selenide,water dikinase